jgi:hypothetical protein
MVPVFASGNVAIFQIDGTEGGALVDISAYVQSVKFSGERKAMKLPVIGGGGVKKLAGPTDASLEIKGHYDAATLGPIFTSYMTDTTPTTRSDQLRGPGCPGRPSPVRCSSRSSRSTRTPRARRVQRVARARRQRHRTSNPPCHERGPPWQIHRAQDPQLRRHHRPRGAAPASSPRHPRVGRRRFIRPLKVRELERIEKLATNLRQASATSSARRC